MVYNIVEVINMLLNTNQLISMTEANQNFSKVTRSVDEHGQVVIIKNNKPKYLVIDMTNSNMLELNEDEKIEIIAKRILNKHLAAFKELAR